MKSKILEFYKDQNVLVTGATGFIGMLLVEQLLRKCDIKRLYILIRSKKDEDPAKRMEKLFDEVIFERLKREKPWFIEKVSLISGDLMQDNFALSDESLAKIIDNVNIVFHAGANVKFDESLKVIVKTNVEATMAIIQICHKMKHLKSFVYLSTAYSNCPNNYIEERFYKPPMRLDDLFSITRNIENDVLKVFESKILGDWPNVYAFSKAMAENVVQTHAKGLPVCVFRPAIVTGTLAEPVPGWSCNYNGPVALIVGIGLGVIRCAQIVYENQLVWVPCDLVTNCILVSACNNNLNRQTSETPIYNFATKDNNPFTVQKLYDYGNDIVPRIPLEKPVWIPEIISKTPNKIVFTISNFLLHFLPALLFDTVQIVLQRKPGGLKLYRKGMKMLTILEYFFARSWTFADDNVTKLWNALEENDQRLFNFDMNSINWYNYLYIYCKGIRLYIAKEPDETIPALRKRYARQIFLYRCFKKVLFTIFVASCCYFIILKFAFAI